VEVDNIFLLMFFYTCNKLHSEFYLPVYPGNGYGLSGGGGGWVAQTKPLPLGLD
jgi:hypothetical protein